MRWEVPVELNEREQRVARRLARVGKFYLFLREVRSQLFDAEFEAELERAYATARGTLPLPPAMLAMVTLLQAYDHVGDAEAVQTAEMDKRWQLVLDSLGTDEAPFSQGVLVSFRERMVEHDLDRKLLDRTVEVAKQTGKFGWQHLKAVLDSSPLLGAGRVEDTWNLIGRALSTVVDCAAVALSIPRERILDEAKLTLLSGKSLKANLDIDWDDPAQQKGALKRLLDQVRSLESWVSRNAGALAESGPLKATLVALRRVLEQDLEPDPGGGMRLRDGVAKDRMPSLGDKEMRHGRKSKSKTFNGFKRHIVTFGGTDLIAGATARPANEAEHEATPALLDDARRHGELAEIQIDRGYLASPELQKSRQQGVIIRAKPWPSRNAGRFTKEQFRIRLRQRTIECPAGNTAPIIALGRPVRFSANICATCSLRTQCTTAAPERGRSVAIHIHEEMLIELRAAKRTPAGRAALRERVVVEHSLARIKAIQGPRARYKGVRKNTLDLRRCAAVSNLQTLARAA